MVLDPAEDGMLVAHGTSAAGDPTSEGALRSLDRRRRAADVPDPHPAGAAERPDHRVRGGLGEAVGSGARLLRGRSAHPAGQRHTAARSEEHTSELQSLMRISYAVFCLKK